MSLSISNSHRQVSFGRRKRPREAKRRFKQINLNPISSHCFNEVIEARHQSIDHKLLRKIEKRPGFVYLFAQTLKDALPHFDNNNYGHLFAAAAAVHYTTDSGKKGKATVFYENADKNHPMPWQSVFRHEGGHHFDQMFDDIAGCNLVDTDSFQKALSEDRKLSSEKGHLEKLKKLCKKKEFVEILDRYNHYVKESDFKPKERKGQELFAEICAMLNGGSEAEAQCKGFDKFYREAFPNTVEYVKKFLWLLGKRG